jgi:toxin YoeB
MKINKIAFSGEAFDDYNQWAIDDKKVFKRIVSLIKEIRRTPYEGIGKPEPLKYSLSGKWSRRITDEHRIVYSVEKEILYIYSVKFHYK